MPYLSARSDARTSYTIGMCDGHRHDLMGTECAVRVSKYCTDALLQHVQSIHTP